jgi:hypothetical protein
VVSGLQFVEGRKKKKNFFFFSFFFFWFGALFSNAKKTHLRNVIITLVVRFAFIRLVRRLHVRVRVRRRIQMQQLQEKKKKNVKKSMATSSKNQKNLIYFFFCILCLLTARSFSVTAVTSPLCA